MLFSCTFVLGAEPVLRPYWRSQLELHSPTNVVIGNVGEQKQLCVQGTVYSESHSIAAIEMLSMEGRKLWHEQFGVPNQSITVGAYVQWVADSSAGPPAVLYAWVPDSDQEVGGARLVSAVTGELLGTIKNNSRFGNNNSVVADLDMDGKQDLLYADLSSLTRYSLPSLENQWSWDSGVRFCWSLPGLFDLAGDQKPEIVFGSEYNNENGSSSVLAVSTSGESVWRQDGFQEDLGSTPVFHVDVEGDGKMEVLKVGLDLEHRHHLKWNHLHLFESDTGELRSKVELGFTGIALGDLDLDGHVEGVGLTNTRDGGNSGHREIRCIDLVTGQPKWTTSVSRAYLDNNSPVMADLNGDGYLEGVVGTGNPAGYARLPKSQPWGDLYVVDRNGNILQHEMLDGWPVNLAFCDLDEDGLSELVVVLDGKPGSLLVYRTRAKTSRGTWPTPFGDSKRSGTSALN